MGHKVVSQKTIEEAQAEVAYFDGLIANARKCQGGDKEAVAAGMEVVRNLELDAGQKKDAFLSAADDKSVRLAIRWQGKQEAYQDVITTFERPDLIIENYAKQRANAARELEELKQYDIRKD